MMKAAYEPFHWTPPKGMCLTAILSEKQNDRLGFLDAARRRVEVGRPVEVFLYAKSGRKSA